MPLRLIWCLWTCICLFPFCVCRFCCLVFGCVVFCIRLGHNVSQHDMHSHSSCSPLPKVLHIRKCQGLREGVFPQCWGWHVMLLRIWCIAWPSICSNTVNKTPEPIQTIILFAESVGKQSSSSKLDTSIIEHYALAFNLMFCEHAFVCFCFVFVGFVVWCVLCVQVCGILHQIRTQCFPAWHAWS